MLLLTVSIFVIFSQTIFCANILGVISTPMISHQTPFQALWKELSLRGHKVTVLTSHPMQDPSLTNLTEINLISSAEVIRKLNIVEKFISGVDTAESARLMKRFIDDVTTTQLESEDVQKLLLSDQKFDLLLLEPHMPLYVGLVWKFKCPWIMIFSLNPPTIYNGVMGNPIHPVYNPDINFEVQSPLGMNLWERLNSFVYNHVIIEMFYDGILDVYSVKGKRYFGEDLPHLKDIMNNVSMMFMTTHPMTHDIRPLQPNTIPIGTGLHIKGPNPLPLDIMEFLDSAIVGAIYFALGSNVQHSVVMKDFFSTVIPVLSELPYKVLFKFDGKLDDVPKNFLISKWMPQQDILRHPNLKLFITHGGLQSMQETIYNGVPVIVIPLFGDGFGNANKAVKMGYGLKLNAKKLTKQILKNAVEEVINHSKYRENIREAMEIFRDEEIAGVQKAIYWTEYVIKYNGARHLRNPLLHEPLWKYYMLDIFGILLLSLCILLYVTYKIFRFCLYLLKTQYRKLHVD